MSHIALLLLVAAIAALPAFGIAARIRMATMRADAELRGFVDQRGLTPHR